MKCFDCGLEVNMLIHCSHCYKWVCEKCGWLKHEWLPPMATEDLPAIIGEIEAGRGLKEKK